MKKGLMLTLAAAILGIGTLLPLASNAADKPVVRTSAQPCLHGMEIWYADKEGWLKDAPFNSEFLLFSSGSPQTEALAANQWDAGAMGTVPTMMANLRYGYKISGISNDESKPNDIWVRP